MTRVGTARQRWGSWGALALILAIGAWMRCDRLADLDILYDEAQDIGLVRDLARLPQPFRESPAEPADAWDQARLPFYVSLAAVRVTGESSLTMLRRVSVACALLVIVAVFLLGRELFGPAAGLLAAAFQAVSIFDAGFSRLALTSSLSMFLVPFLVSLWCLFRAAREDRVGWWWAAGVAAGAACAAKGFGLFSLFIAAGWAITAPAGRPSVGTSGPTQRLLRGTGLIAAIWAALIVFHFGPNAELAIYLATAGCAVILHAQLIPRARGRLSEEPPASLLAGFTLLAFVYAMAGSPTHLDASRWRAATQWISEWHNMWFVTTRWWDLIEVLIVRLNFPFQLLFLASMWTAIRRRREAPFRLLLLAFWVPFTILTLSRWKSNYYVLTVLPVCYLMIAAWLVHRWERAGRRGRQAWVAAGVVAMLWYGQQVASLAPWYELDGYRLGREFLGQSRAWVLTSERLRHVVTWMDATLPPGTQIGIDLVDHPVYQKYFHGIVSAYARPGQVEFLHRGEDKIVPHPVMLMSLYTEPLEPALRAAGYICVKRFWVLQVPFYRVYVKPEIAAYLARERPEEPFDDR